MRVAEKRGGSRDFGLKPSDTGPGPDSATPYRGRLAPTPSGHLHRGHAATFIAAWKRCREQAGTLVMRVEDIDRQRCQPEFETAALDDLRWLGLDWDEGPDVGGPCGPYRQSDARAIYLEQWETLRRGGWIYPCTCTRKDLAAALSAPHEQGGEALYPGTCRPPKRTVIDATTPEGVNWRFRVPDGESINWTDGRLGPQRHQAGRDFGDFLVWRKDHWPSYQLAVVADDLRMGITEVVRGEDLLLSTARQLLLYRALGATPPAFWHAPLIYDASGKRLSKREHSTTLLSWRQAGKSPRPLWDQGGSPGLP